MYFAYFSFIGAAAIYLIILIFCDQYQRNKKRKVKTVPGDTLRVRVIL